MTCGLCYKKLEEPTLEDTLKAHELYRQDFPNTHNRSEPVIVCVECYEKLREQISPNEWDVLNG